MVPHLAILLGSSSAFLGGHQFLNVFEVEFGLILGQDFLLDFFVVDALNQLVQHHFVAVVVLLVAGTAGACR